MLVSIFKSLNTFKVFFREGQIKFYIAYAMSSRVLNLSKGMFDVDIVGQIRLQLGLRYIVLY